MLREFLRRLFNRRTQSVASSNVYGSVTQIRGVRGDLHLGVPCPHGYERGEHHWYSCTGTTPF